RTRSPSRKQRVQLETLEERTVLSTYTISEYMFFGARHLVETVDNVTSDLNLGANPTTVTLNTASGGNTINILNTSAGITINIVSGGPDTVNVGDPSSSGSVQGILAPVWVQDPPSYTTLNVNDSADTTAEKATLSTSTFNGASYGCITGLAPAGI